VSDAEQPLGDEPAAGEYSGDEHLADVELNELLGRAEAILARRTGHRPELDHDETMRLVHQLAVHQIELDLQQQELRQARERLAESLARYVDLYDFAPAGYLTLDVDGVVVQSNLTGAELLGVERARALGLRFVDKVAQADRDMVDRFIERALRTRGEHTCEVPLVRYAQPNAVVAIEARRTPAGDQLRLALVDVTELRQAQLAAAQFATVAQREETARMLHDTVQQRLFGMSSSLQALQMHPSLEAGVRERIGALVDDLEVTITNIRQTIFDQRRGWSLDDPNGRGTAQD
jgi:PAS domain S-box-containing protein